MGKRGGKKGKGARRREKEEAAERDVRQQVHKYACVFFHLSTGRTASALAGGPSDIGLSGMRKKSSFSRGVTRAREGRLWGGGLGGQPPGF